MLLNGSIAQYYGRGGYSYGNYSMNLNKKLYVSVGGKGQDGIVGTRSTGGWNGGGNGDWDHLDDEATGAGGGCSSIQISLKNDGQLKNYSSVKNTDVLIVAGGAGATNQRTNGDVSFGYGGGETGSISKDYSYNESKYNKQAGQTSGYAFGLGQSVSTSIDYAKYTNSEIPGAGGGWYGGYTVTPDNSGGTYASVAGGGSGHIGTMLTNGKTIAGNQTIPSPTGGTETGHSGNGYCKITWMPVL
jgi:hypothetical protein